MAGIPQQKIFLSDDPAPFDHLDIVYPSCDIGIMIHGPLGESYDKNLYIAIYQVEKSSII